MLALTSDGYGELNTGLPLQNPGSAALSCRELAAVVHLPCLISLSLEWFGLHATDLIMFLQKHAQIVNIKLRQVALMSDWWSNLIVR